jgi:hypothetical protein
MRARVICVDQQRLPKMRRCERSKQDGFTLPTTGVEVDHRTLQTTESLQGRILTLVSRALVLLRHRRPIPLPAYASTAQPAPGERSVLILTVVRTVVGRTHVARPLSRCSVPPFFPGFRHARAPARPRTRAPARPRARTPAHPRARAPAHPHTRTPAHPHTRNDVRSRSRTHRRRRTRGPVFHRACPSEPTSALLPHR